MTGAWPLRALRWLDDRHNAVERHATVGLLLFIVLLAAVQAALRNAVRYEWSWAKTAMQHMYWVDSVLGQSCFLLVFIGASLATTAEKHMSIDIIVVHLDPRRQALLRAIARTCAGLVTVALAYGFLQVVVLIMSEFPLELAVLGTDGPIHVCDGTVEQVAGAPDLERPWLLCNLRTAIAVLAMPVDTFNAMVKALVPYLLLVSGLRLLGQGFQAGRTYATWDSSSDGRSE